MKDLTRFLLILLLAGVSTAAQAEPGSKEIEAKINAWIEGKELSLEDLRYKTFVNDDPSIGRVSVAGNLKLLGDRGVLAKQENIETEIVSLLAQKGYSKDQVERGARSVGLKKFGYRAPLFGQRAVVYKPTMRKGTLIPFTAEMSFMETVDGFNLRGKMKYDVPDRAMSALLRNPSTDLLYGGVEYNARLAAIEQGAYFHKNTHPRIRERLVQGLLGTTLHYYEEEPIVARVTKVRYSTDKFAKWEYGNANPLGANRASVNIFERGVVLTILPERDMELGYNNFVKAGVPAELNVRVTVSADFAFMDEICLRGYTSGNRLCYVNGQIGFHTPKNQQGRHVNQYGFLDDRKVGKSIVFRVHN